MPYGYPGIHAGVPYGYPGIHAGVPYGYPGIHAGERVMSRQAAGFIPRLVAPSRGFQLPVSLRRRSHPVMCPLSVQIRLRLRHAHLAQAPHEVARTPERILMQLVQVREYLP